MTPHQFRAGFGALANLRHSNDVVTGNIVNFYNNSYELAINTVFIRWLTVFISSLINRAIDKAVEYLGHNKAKDSIQNSN